MKKKLPITKNKDVVVSWVYTWSKQQDMSIHEQRIVLRILEACQAELKGVKLKDYAGTKQMCIRDSLCSVSALCVFPLSLIHI